MRKILFAALAAAAFATNAHAGNPPSPPQKDDKRFDFKFDFDFGNLDFGMLLADAGDDARRTAEQVREHAEKMRAWAQEFSSELQGSMAYLFADRVGRGKTVKGAPYSAEIVTETNQALADGNVITHKSSNRVYRDGEGRTRQETYRDNDLRSIYITDPVEGSNYTLIPTRKVAIRAPRVEFHTHVETRSRSRDKDKEKEKDKTSRKEDGPSSREEVRVQVVRIGSGDASDYPLPPVPPVPPVPPTAPGAVPPVPPVPPLPGLNTLRFESTARLGKGVTTVLAPKTIEGVRAEGKSTTWTIPAGQIGNRNPINITSESWYSPDLQVTVYSRYNDPRTGESIYRLAGLKRGEPSADLFKVPQDYTVRGRSPRDKEKDRKEER